jgi:hypothetical protein
MFLGRSIAAKETRNAEVLIEVGPVNTFAVSQQLEMISLLECGV